MYTAGLNFQQYNYNTTRARHVSGVKNDEVKQVKTPAFTSNPITNVPYNPTLTSSDLRTRLSSKPEKDKYNFLQKNLDKVSKKQLKELLNSGILLNANSNDKSTVLDNLYKIASTPRASRAF